MAHYAINGVNLWVEEDGAGPPMVFVHEFGGDVRAWRFQIAHFRQGYRCVAYNARGYPPSGVPDDEAAYSVDIALADLLGVLDALAIERAHLVGLSMGAYTILRFAMAHPERVLSLTAASGGSGSHLPTRDHFITETLAVAEQMLAADSLADAPLFAGPTRIQLRRKRPDVWAEFAGNFAGFSPQGAGRTLRQVQATRPSLYDFEAELAGVGVPTLLLIGDEDELVIEVNVFLKRTMPTAGLAVLPKSGHLINLEDPAIFNRAIDEFLAAVATARWPVRAPGTTGANAYTPQEDT